MQLRSAKKKAKRKSTPQRKQVNIRIEPPLYQALEAVAGQEHRSIPQTARQLLEEGLQHRVGGQVIGDEISSHEIATLAAAGGAFDWLAEEPDLYDDTWGEPL